MDDPEIEPLPGQMAYCKHCHTVSHMNEFGWISYRIGFGYYGSHKKCPIPKAKHKYVKPQDTLF